MAPIVHGLEAQFYEQMNFVYLDIDDPKNDGFKESLGYRYQPHIYLLDEDGKVLQQWVGPVSREELEQAFEAALET
jgi:hypothetical protein